MKMQYLIDGYNLLFQIPECRKYLDNNLEGARDKLIWHLGTYAKNYHHKMIVVFDGEGEVSHHQISDNHIKIIFSGQYEKADPVIKRIIGKNERQKNWIVISSDNEISGYARVCGLKFMTSQNFMNELFKKPEKKNPARDSNDDLDDREKKFDFTMEQEELDEWMKLFKEKRKDK
jgi:predicted RNA-binding protein with PIN domain